MARLAVDSYLASLAPNLRANDHGRVRADALVAPTATAAWMIDAVYGDPNEDSFSRLPAVAVYPHLTVPMGQVHGLPIGLSFIGAAHAESLLLALGASYEQRRGPLPEPRFLTTVATSGPKR